MFFVRHRLNSSNSNFNPLIFSSSLWPPSTISSFLSCQASGNLIFWPESAKNWDSVPAFRSWMSDKTTKNKLSLLVGQVSFLSTMMKLMTTGQSRRTQSEGCGQLPGIRQRACQEAKRVLTTDSANLKCCAVVARAWCVRTSTGTVKQRGPSTWKSEPFSNFLLIYLSLFNFQGQITHAKNKCPIYLVEDFSLANQNSNLTPSRLFRVLWVDFSLLEYYEPTKIRPNFRKQN